MSNDRKEPGGEAPAEHAEQVRADRFGELVDTLVAGDRLPPAMTSEDRELIGVATMLRVTTGGMSLSSSRASTLVGQAFEAATMAREQGENPHLPTIAPAERSKGDDLATRRRRGLKPALPWLLTVTASAAALMLWYAQPNTSTVAETSPPPATLKINQQSRPADRIVGMIARNDAHLASSRLDVIYADRLEGYRSLRLSVGVGRGGTRD